MLELKECCKVPFPEKLFEQYEVGEKSICANIGASKILAMMKRFVEMHNDELLFFILELPRKNKDDITESKWIVNAPNDYDVYFIDGLDAEHACQCLDAMGDFLVTDGMNVFGIGGHESHEEILFGAYNVTTLYTENAEKYREFFHDFGIEPTNALITAWDTFDREHCGECSMHVSRKTGKTVYDIPQMYEECGMYLYETRKEYDGEGAPITYEELVGKVLLVGITYYTADGEFIEQKQIYGIVTVANECGISLVTTDKSFFSLPPDLSSVKRAELGEYKLRSTGETVSNPDFLATWALIKAEKD